MDWLLQGGRQGEGREIQTKIHAEPGDAPQRDLEAVVFNNNQRKPTMQYELFFSQLAERRHRFEFGVEVSIGPRCQFGAQGMRCAAVQKKEFSCLEARPRLSNQSNAETLNKSPCRRRRLCSPELFTDVLAESVL